MTQHTPGPWKAEPIQPHCLRFAVTGMSNFGADPQPVAVVDTMACARRSPARDECEANARLIAAAPEMAKDLLTMRDLAAMILNRQHAGQPIADRIWSELFAATNKASATLAKAEG